MSARRPWTRRDDTVLRTLHGNGRPISYIATFLVRGKKSVVDRAEVLGLAFGTNHQWTDAENAVLHARYPNESTDVIARDLGLQLDQVYRHAARLGLKKSDAYMESDKAGRIQRGRTDPRMVATQFKKGSVPANKGLRRPGWAPGRMASTQFKKGEMSGAAKHNYVPIGTERLSKEGYLERKVTDDPAIVRARRWVGVHILIWQEANGPVAAGHCLAFRDRNKTHIALDNLELITRAENMRRNSFHNNYPKEVAQLIQLKSALNRKINRLSKEQTQ